ncbi:hypothetical protein HYE08_02950 [Mycoplasmopsis bovis]|nr:hypothetical protein [Mycoplasmopsis bovis]QQH27118.1 hypothetical protein HYE08_02950 [Mycoplasmopsis bovis]
MIHIILKKQIYICALAQHQKSINDENLSKILVPLASIVITTIILELIHKLDSLIGKYSKFEIELSELE